MVHADVVLLKSLSFSDGSVVALFDAWGAIPGGLTHSNAVRIRALLMSAVLRARLRNPNQVVDVGQPHGLCESDQSANLPRKSQPPLPNKGLWALNNDHERRHAPGPWVGTMVQNPGPRPPKMEITRSFCGGERSEGEPPVNVGGTHTR